MDRVKRYLKQGVKTIISIAPSYLGVLEYDKPGPDRGCPEAAGLL